MFSRMARISTRKRNALMKAFIADKMASMAAEDCKVSKNTANRWYRSFRESIYTHLRRYPKFLGEVELDQSSFGGRGRKRMQAYLKRLANTLPHSQYLAKARQVRAEHKVQVFGILNRGGEVFTYILKKNDKNSIMPLIRLTVEQGSVVYTDKWRGFVDLGLDGYTHHSINHSEEYVDQKGNHINGIEAFWSFAGRRLRKFNGIPKTTLPLHIKECEYRYNHRDDLEKALKSLLKGI